jgi:hypothetical protein
MESTVATRAQAAPAAPSSVQVALPACSPGPFDAQAFLSLLQIELRADGVERVLSGGEAAGGGSLAVITLRTGPCSELAREIEIVIDDRATQKSVRRVIDITDVPAAARPRALSLAVAELLRASWVELAVRAAPPPPSPPPPPLLAALPSWLSREALPAVRVAPPPGPPAPGAPSGAPSGAPAPGPPGDVARFSWTAAAEARMFFRVETGLVGGRVGSSFQAAPWLVAGVDAGVLSGSRADPLGEITLRVVTGAASISAVSAAGPLSLRVGPRLEVGRAFASGSSSDESLASGASAGGWVAMASLSAGARAGLGAGISALVDVDVGATLRGFDALADGRRALGVGGGLAGLRVGVGGEL